MSGQKDDTDDQPLMLDSREFCSIYRRCNQCHSCNCVRGVLSSSEEYDTSKLGGEELVTFSQQKAYFGGTNWGY